jgi:hypothetical protein
VSLHDPANEQIEASLDSERFEFEKQNAQRSADFEERRFNAENRNRWWTPLSIVFPLLVLITTQSFNQRSDRQKSIADQRQADLKERRALVQRQLSDLYYPLLFASEKDDILWCFAIENAEGCKDAPSRISQLSQNEQGFVDSEEIVANHREALDLIKRNFGLLRNADEGDLSHFLDMIQEYERNATLYMALRSHHDRRVPADFGVGYPTGFTKAIQQQILSLEAQEKALTGLIESH